MIPLSVLDLVPVRQGGDPAQALRSSLELAQSVEAFGYRRFWVAEHHNMTGIASAATSVVIGYLAGGTRTIRVGAGGIMLPNHAPLIIAEQFGTLESLYPGRIDLGLGRAPGTDQLTARAMRRDPRASDQFPEDVLELRALFGPVQPGQQIRAVPGANLNVPLWILGSSLYGAQLAAYLGLPYAFASHFAPDALDQALLEYRTRFQAGEQGQPPYAMPCINVIVAETDEAAIRLFTSLQMRFTDMVRNQRGLLPPPIDDINDYWNAGEQAHVRRMLTCSFVGSPTTVQQALQGFVERTGADELMISSAVFDTQARIRSYELLADIGQALTPRQAGSEMAGQA
ncbi:MAG: LLM class flavin-dependent oxidoreductase [Burkholderiaceae bacterium]